MAISLITILATGGFIGRHPGILLVIVGVLGEVVCYWNSKREVRERLKKLFGIVLVFGLVWEIVEAVKSDKEVADAKKLAAYASLETAKLVSSNLDLEITIEEIRQRNNQLEARQYPRVSQLNWDSFVASLKSKPTWGAEVLFKKEDGESFELARAIRVSLSSAGWHVAPLRSFAEEDLPPSQSTNWPPGIMPYGAADTPSSNWISTVPLEARFGVSESGMAFIVRKLETEHGGSWDSQTNDPYEELSVAWMSASIHSTAKTWSNVGGFEDTRLPEGFIKIVVGQR